MQESFEFKTYILVECPFLNDTRQRFNSENILMDIFKKDSPEILEFLVIQ